MDLGLLIIRVVIGLVMAGHGAQKLFGWFGGPGLNGTSGMLGSLGFKPAKLHATVTALSEFGGGILLAAGLLTPLGAAAIIGVMIVAIVTVHAPKGLWNSGGGYEFNLVLLAGAAGIGFAGPGSYSLDSAINLSLAGGWGLAALVVAIVAAAGVLTTRSRPTRQQEQDRVSTT